MKYENAFDEYVSYLPEKAEEIKSRMVEEDVAPNEGMHIVYGEVLVPLMIEWIEGSDSAARKALAFVEELARCNDKLIGELLDFTIIESFVDQNAETYAAIKELAGPQTLIRCKSVEEYLPNID